MKGLFVKDLMILSKSWMMMALVTLVVGGCLLYFDTPVGMGTYMTVFFTMQGISTILPDKSCHWNLYQTALPISRKNAIREKYLLSLGLAVIGLAAGFLIVWIFVPDLDSNGFWINLLIGLMLSSCAVAIVIPLAIRLHPSQYFLALLCGFLPPALCLVLWIRSIDSTFIGGMARINYHLDLLGWMTAGCMLLLFLSFWLMPGLLAKTDQN